MGEKDTILDLEKINPELNKFQEDIHQQTMEDLSNLGGIFGKNKDLSFKMTKIRWLDREKRGHEREILDKKQLLASQLSAKSGIKIEDISDENMQELIQRYENDSTIKSIMKVINSHEGSANEIKNKLKVEREKYNNIDEERIKLLNNIDNKALRFTTSLAGGVVQGVLDPENLLKNIAIHYVTAGFGTAFKLGRYGIKGVEYGLDFIDNYISMQKEHKLLNPEGKELTSKELVIGSVTGLLAEGVFDGARYGIKNITKGVFGDVGGEIQKQVVKDIIENPDISFGTTTPKQILKTAYDIENGKGEADIKLYKQAVEQNPDMEYRPELDPQNPHKDIYDTAYDENLTKVTDNNEVYYKDGDTVKKVQIPDDEIVQLDNKLNNGLITQEEYNKLKQDYIDQYVYEVDNGIEVGSKLYPPKDYKRNRFDKSTEEPLKLKEGDNLTTREVVTNEYIDYEQKIKQGEYGDSAVVDDGATTKYIYKDSNGDIVVQSERKSDINKPVKDVDSDNHYHVRQVKEALNKKTKVIKKDGTTKSINGMQKLHYWGQLKRLGLLPNVVQKVLKFADALSPDIMRKTSRKFSIKGSLGRWSMGRLVDTLFVNDINGRWKNIVSNNYSLLKELMKDENGNYFYADIEDMFDDINEKSLIEMFVKGDTDQVIFKTARENNDFAKEQLKKWVKILRDNNAFLQSYKNNINFIEGDISISEFQSKYGKFITIDEDGYVDFNTGKGGFFEGLDDEGINKKLLDIYINPEKIDLNMIDGIDDRDMFNNIFGDITLDEQNGMAIELAFKNNEDYIDMLHQFGLVSINENGRLVSSMEDFTSGLCNIIKEMANPDSKFDKVELQNLIKSFYDMTLLPKKIDVKDGNVVGDNSINLIDFVFNNKSNSTVDMKQLHKVLAPILSNLGESIEDKIKKIEPITQVNVEDLSTQKIDFDNINKVTNILNRWVGIFNKDNKANAYLLSDKFNKELKQVNEILSSIDSDEAIPSKNIVNDIKGETYQGKITFDNISENINPAIDGVLEAIDNQQKVVNDFSNIKQIIGRKRNIKSIVEGEDYKTKVNDLIPELKKLNVSDDTINKLKSTNIKDVKEAFNEIDNILSNTTKNNEKVLSNLDAFDKLKTPEDIREYLKHTRNREKLQSVLKTMEDYGVDTDTVSDIRDFINYHGKEYDYKLDKKNIINNINAVLSEINNLKGQLDVENYGERITAYRELLQSYQQLNSLIRDNTGDKSVAFIQKKDIDKLYNKIKTNSEIVGEDVNDILEYENILKGTQKILGEIQESNKQSPLKHLNKDFVGGYKSSSTTEAHNFGVLEMLINKDIWLSDREWFTKTDKQIMKVLFDKVGDKKITDVKDIPEGITEQFIDKKYLEMFKNLYDYAVDKFKGVEELDADGNVINSTPLTLDQFVFVYGKFLDELNKTKRSNKRQSIGALKVFFNSEDDMLSFFTQRKKMYGNGYVKDNADAITLFNDINSMQFAEISKLGMTLQQFANRLNPSNKSVRNIVDKSLANETIDDVTVTKENKEVYDNMFRSVSDFLKRTHAKKTGDLVGYADGGINDWIDKGLNIIYPILLNGTGIIESFTNDIRAVHMTTYMDAKGRTFGYKSNNRIIGPAKQYSMALLKGIVKGTATIPAVVINGLTGAWNILADIDRYFLFSNYMNTYHGKNYDLRIKPDMVKYTLTNFFGSKILSKLTGADRDVVKGVLDAYISKKFMKGKPSFTDPKNLKFKGHKREYIGQSIREAFNDFSDTAISIQEISDVARDICSSIRSNNLMEEFMTKDFDLLPEQIVGQLKSFGIDKENYKLFQESLYQLSDKNGHINIFLRDLFGQLDTDDTLKDIDKHMLGAIEGLANHFHETAFTLNKQHKYSVAEQSALSKIMFALRHSTLGMGSEDLINLLYDETESGVYKAKWKRFSNAKTLQDKVDVAGNMVANGVPSFLMFALASTGAVTVGMLFDDITRKFSNFRRDLAEKRAELEVTKRIWAKDDSVIKKTGLTLLYASKRMPKDILQTVPLTAFLSNKNNIFDTYKNIAGDFYVALWETLKDPHEINEKEFNKHLSSLGIKTHYSKEEHLKQGNMLPLIAATGTALTSTFFKYPYSMYKAIVKDNPYQHNLDTAEKIKKYNDTLTGEIAADIYMNSLRRAEPKDDELVPAPDVDNLNDYGKELVGTAMLKTYTNIYEQLLDNAEANNIQANNVINQYAYKNDIYDDKTYTDNQLELYKDMKLDEKIDKLPEIYKWAMEDIESTYQELNELDRNELRLLMLNDIQENEPTPRELINKFARNDDEIDKIYENKEQQEQVKYKNFDDVPEVYKMYYDDMVEKGRTVTKEAILSLANSNAPIPRE